MVKCRIILLRRRISNFVRRECSSRADSSVGVSERRNTSDFVAAENAGALDGGAAPLLDRAVGVEWYEQHGTDIDHAALTLCLLRRARAGERGGPQGGDEAVRTALAEASPEAVVWLASRAISYMDETGFPEAVSAAGSRRRRVERRRLSGRVATEANRREERGRGQVWRKGELTCLLASDDTRAAAEESRALLAAASSCASEYTAPFAEAASRSSIGRADGSARYWGSGTPRVKTRSSSPQNWTKITSMAGSAGRAPRGERSPPAGSRRRSARCKPLLRSRREVAEPTERREGVQRRRARRERGSRRRPLDASERSSVASNTSASVLGKRCGSTRSVSEAIPTGTSGRDARSVVAAAFARSMRVAASPDLAVPASSATRRGRRTPPRPCARCGRSSTRRPAAPRRGRAERPPSDERDRAGGQGFVCGGSRTPSASRTCAALCRARKQCDQRHDESDGEQRAERGEDRQRHSES